MKDLIKFKDKLIRTYNYLNNIDINSIFENLKKTDLSDIKKLKAKDIVFFLKESEYSKYIISLIFFISFIYFLLIPNIKIFNSKYKLSRQYIKESRGLLSLNDELFKIKKKYKKINSSMEKIQSSIIEKEKLIYLTNLFDQLSKSTSVSIDLFSPINKSRELSFCKISEISQVDKKSNIKKNQLKRETNNIENAIYELKLNGNYLDIITFLNSIQNYEIITIANCLQVESRNLNEADGTGIVKANLILKLPLR